MRGAAASCSLTEGNSHVSARSASSIVAGTTWAWVSMIIRFLLSSLAVRATRLAEQRGAAARRAEHFTGFVRRAVDDVQLLPQRAAVATRHLPIERLCSGKPVRSLCLAGAGFIEKPV